MSATATDSVEDLYHQLQEINRQLRAINNLKKLLICTKCQLSKAELDCQCSMIEVDAEYKRIKTLELQIFRLNRELDARHMAAQIQKESEFDHTEINWDSDEEEEEEDDDDDDDDEDEDESDSEDENEELDNQITKGVFTQRMMEKNSKGDMVEVEYTKEIIDNNLTDVKYFPYETTYTNETITEITHKYILDQTTGRYQYRETISCVKSILFPKRK